MVKESLEKLDEVKEKDVSLNETLGEMLEFKRNQLTRLQRESLNEQSNLIKLQDQQKSAQSEADYKHRVAEEKHKQVINSQGDVIRMERSRLEQLDEDLVARTKIVEDLESKVAYIKEELNKLDEERISIESQRVRNEEIVVENDRLSNEAYALNEEVSRRTAEVKARETKAKSLLSQAEKQNAKLDKREKDVSLQLENLTKIKKSVDPKLSKIRELSEQAEKDREQSSNIQNNVSLQQADLDEKRTELVTLATQNEAKGKSLIEWELRLKQTEAELKIKSQLKPVSKGKKETKK